MITKENIDLLLGIGALISMAWGFWKFVWPVLKVIRSILQRLEATVDVVLGTPQQPGLQEQLEDLRKQLNAVVKEVRPNGGASMNDAVTVVRGELRALLDADQGVARWSADRNGLLSWASKSYLRWTDSTPATLERHGWLSLVHPDDREDVREEWLTAIEERRGSSFRFRLSDGKGGWTGVYGEAAPILNPIGHVTGWLGTLARTNEAAP